VPGESVKCGLLISTCVTLDSVSPRWKGFRRVWIIYCQEELTQNIAADQPMCSDETLYPKSFKVGQKLL